jgi:hypothetical protein
MNNNTELLSLVNKEYIEFQKIKHFCSIVPDSVPILWFGDSSRYFQSSKKILTVSLNPSNKEFCEKGKAGIYSTRVRFPAFNGKASSLYEAYDEYFNKNPYNSWFKASFSSVLKSFSASH